MAVVLIVAGRECTECGTITFVTDRRGHHATECRADRRGQVVKVDNFVLPVSILSSAEPSTNQVDVAKFTIRYDWEGKTFWREVAWPS